MTSRILIALLALSPVVLAGCSAAGVAVGAGATAGVAAAEERGLDGALKDARISTTINEAWLRHDAKMFDALNLQIYEGRVLVSGALADEAKRDEAIRIAWQAPGVVDVINEIRTEGEPGFESATQDAWISTQLNSRLLFTKGVDSINYSVEVEDGTVYLLGIAQDDVELDKALAVARNTPYVRKVVSHVITKDDPRRRGGA